MTELKGQTMNATRSTAQSKRFHRTSERPRTNGSAGNAKRSYARYITLAREAAAVGDAIEMENCYKHAEHFFRTMRSLSP
jgi:hypothetical protein